MKQENQGYNAVTWNHRIVEHTDSNNNKFYSIQEAYYDEDGMLQTHTTDFQIQADTIDDLITEINLIAEAVNRPIIEDIEIEHVEPHDETYADEPYTDPNQLNLFDEDEETIDLDELVREYPNNMELGKVLRQIVTQ